jgi:hypothetical protein
VDGQHHQADGGDDHAEVARLGDDGALALGTCGLEDTP